MLFQRSSIDVRSKKIVGPMYIKGDGIEYGPLNRMILEKRRFPKVKYVDFAPREALVEKYKADPNVDVAKIPEIDIVTAGRPITEFVGSQDLDFVIASHVMEHVPDMIGWLETNLSILKPGGHIGIAFPDRRYCFDIAKNKTLFSELVAAYLEKRTQPDFTQICDHVFNTARMVPAEAWSGATDASNAPTIHSKEFALKALREIVKSSDYYDTHCWKFSDDELYRTLLDIRDVVKLPFEIVNFLPAEKNSVEFFITLEKV